MIANLSGTAMPGRLQISLEIFLGISLDIATQRASAALITAHPWLP
jgi:hypothetical protein